MKTRWTFVVNEVSAGCYHCEAIRNSDNNISISLTGSEEAIPRLLHDAFKIEVQRGTVRSEAAFLIASGFKYDWLSEYSFQVFGSWIVKSWRDSGRVIFDGKERFLTVLDQSNKLKWEGRVDDLDDPKSGFYRAL